MDELKQAALGGQNVEPETDVFSDAVAHGNEYGNSTGDSFVEDKGVTGGIGMPKETGGSPLETPVDNPDLESMRRSMQADYTRKTQELADQRRELERQMAYVSQLQYMQQMGQQPTNAQVQEMKGILDRLPPTTRASMEPEAQQVLEIMETVIRDEVESRMKSALNGDEIGTLKRSIEELKNQQWLNAKQTEANAITAKYGNDKIQPYLTQIAGVLQQNRNLTVEQALMHVAPHVIQQYWMEQGVRHAHTQKQRQQQAALEAMRSGPSANPLTGFREGESMWDSAQAVMGASAANLEQ